MFYIFIHSVLITTTVSIYCYCRLTVGTCSWHSQDLRRSNVAPGSQLWATTAYVRPQEGQEWTRNTPQYPQKSMIHALLARQRDEHKENEMTARVREKKKRGRQKSKDNLNNQSCPRASKSPPSRNYLFSHIGNPLIHLMIMSWVPDAPN